MKALTISQPYASLIASGEKWVENRRWGTSYRGPLAIHAGKGTQYVTRDQLQDFPNGGVIAVAQLIACMPLASMQRLSRHQRLFGRNLTLGEILDHRHTEGPWCWILQDVRAVPFMACRGGQGLWEFEFPEAKP